MDVNALFGYCALPGTDNLAILDNNSTEHAICARIVVLGMDFLEGSITVAVGDEVLIKWREKEGVRYRRGR